MEFSTSPRAADLVERVRRFVAERIVPAEVEICAQPVSASEPWRVHPLISQLQQEARSRGLWNLFLPAGIGDEYARQFGTDGDLGLSNVDYAPVAEEMGHSVLAPLVFNCNAPDTGDMEVLLKYGTPQQRQQWLEPLLDGQIRSAFLMTEPDVASSDATNLRAAALLDGDDVVIDGRKWWSSGAAHPDCRVAILMGRTFPDAHRHSQHSMVLVEMEAPGVTVVRRLSAMGQLDAPLGHAEVSLSGVRVPRSNVIGEPGEAFAIAQGRLGPGRIHHCMRLVGLAEMALDLACRRAAGREAFGRPIWKLGGTAERLARARIEINQARLLVLHAAWKLDRGGSRGAISEVSQIKVAVPEMACRVIDMAIQIHGGAGMGQDLPLAAAYAAARSLRIADGPDEVHLSVVARAMLRSLGSDAPGDQPHDAAAPPAVLGGTGRGGPAMKAGQR